MARKAVTCVETSSGNVNSNDRYVCEIMIAGVRGEGGGGGVVLKVLHQNTSIQSTKQTLLLEDHSARKNLNFSESTYADLSLF